MTDGLTRKDTNFIGSMFFIVVILILGCALLADSHLHDICAAVECSFDD